MDSQSLLLIVIFYGALLFAIAWLTERYGHKINKPWWRPLIYTLSIGVYCSSWTFLGAVGQAVNSGWHFLPIYLGPILLFLFGWRFLHRLITVSARNKVTSIADFIGSRYGKYQPLAAAVTLVLVIGTLPYIALQLRAVDIAWSSTDWRADSVLGTDLNSSLVTAMIMAWFAIVFGTRVIDGPEKLRGLMAVISMESIIKLVAFVMVALLAFSLLDEARIPLTVDYPQFNLQQILSPRFMTEMLLAATAIICLPRQFHVMVVEFQQESDLRYTRWLLPLYLALFAILVIPLAQAGSIFLSGLGVPADSYVLMLPSWNGQPAILALAFIGALSAATGMVVVATVALSIMISNELIVPLWLRFSSHKKDNSSDLAGSLRLIRRISIVSILVMAWWLERIMLNHENLAGIGLISFAACAQLLPAILAALYWPNAHRKGVMAGLIAGMFMWFYCLLLPLLLPADSGLMNYGLFQVGWLKPHDLFYSGHWDILSHGVFWSLSINILVFVCISWRSALTALDVRQASAFVQRDDSLNDSERPFDPSPSGIEVRQLQALAEPLFGDARSLNIWHEFEQQLGHRLLPTDQAPRFVVTAIESDLAAIIGAVSARKAIKLLIGQQPLFLQDFVSLMGGSSRQIQFSQTLLQTTLDTIPQGVSVVDKDLKLVVWNQQYQQMFDYPKRLLYVGCDISKVYYYNAVRGYLGRDKDPVDAIVTKRMQQLATGNAYRLERRLPNDKVIEIRGTPLANGGYVTTYTDVSDYDNMLSELETNKHQLEERVKDRTAELQQVNDSLLRENELRSRVESELKSVNASKSHFMAAASHDLLQPINAARLFTSSLIQLTKEENSTLKQTVDQLDDALLQSEHLINSLRDISRLRSGKERPKRDHCSLHELLKSLAAEAGIIAQDKKLDFHWVDCQQWLFTDPHLLRRIVQNFLSNALRYTQEGKVLLGCRRIAGGIVIEVWDTGPGISEENRLRIFEEFERLPGSSMQGLGLGLSIAQNIAQLLGHEISLDSTLGKGSVFRITVPIGEKKNIVHKKRFNDPNLVNVKVLCVDNEPRILAGMQSLLEQWGCQVTTARDLGQALSLWRDEVPPQLVLADFHLDKETGLDVLEALQYHWQQPLPAVIISADNSDEVRDEVLESGYLYLPKPIIANSLRMTMNRALRRIKK
jgi:signal transduction histidine kinase/Na+/proline symporter/CheY-like chemotaxis protein/PAS domain-containing protein